jgi:hypothetical protein
MKITAKPGVFFKWGTCLECEGKRPVALAWCTRRSCAPSPLSPSGAASACSTSGTRDFLVLADLLMAFASVLTRDSIELVYVSYARRLALFEGMRLTWSA